MFEFVNELCHERNFVGVRDYVQSLGFIKTHYGQLYHTFAFAKEIRRHTSLTPETS